MTFARTHSELVNQVTDLSLYTQKSRELLFLRGEKVSSHNLSMKHPLLAFEMLSWGLIQQGPGSRRLHPGPFWSSPFTSLRLSFPVLQNEQHCTARSWTGGVPIPFQLSHSGSPTPFWGYRRILIPRVCTGKPRVTTGTEGCTPIARTGMLAGRRTF